MQSLQLALLCVVVRHLIVTRDYSLYTSLPFIPPGVPAVPGSRTPLKPPPNATSVIGARPHSRCSTIMTSLRRFSMQHDNGQPRVDEQLAKLVPNKNSNRCNHSPAKARALIKLLASRPIIDLESRSISHILPSPSLATSSGCMHPGQIVHNLQSRM